MNTKKRLNHTLWMLMEFHIHRYLISNTFDRLDGAGKGMHHQELCNIYIASVEFCEKDECFIHIEKLELIHEKTQELTSYMDEVIGFPIDSRPDYDDLAPKFFRKFIELADNALSERNL